MEQNHTWKGRRRRSIVVENYGGQKEKGEREVLHVAGSSDVARSRCGAAVVVLEPTRDASRASRECILSRMSDSNHWVAAANPNGGLLRIYANLHLGAALRPCLDAGATSPPARLAWRDLSPNTRPGASTVGGEGPHPNNTRGHSNATGEAMSGWVPTPVSGVDKRRGRSTARG